MMGERMVAHEALFYEFSWSGMCRQITCARFRFVDLSAIREHLRPYYSEMGDGVGLRLTRS